MITQNLNYDEHYQNLFLNNNQAPQFDQITNEDFSPALNLGIAEEDNEISKIVNCHSRPTFANTIARLDESGKLLKRVTDVFYNLLDASSDKAKQALAEKFSPILSDHYSNIMLNKDLFQRVKYVYQHPGDSLTPEELRLTEKFYLDFKRNGALLKGEKRETYHNLNETLAKLTLQFQKNVLHARKAFSINITDKNELEGVPENVLESAAATAAENEQEGWTITLDEPVYGPIMTYCKNRGLRHKLYMAYHNVCTKEDEDCNIIICKRIINTRREIAQLLGYNTYADYVMEMRMAKKTENVYKLFDMLLENYLEPAKKEIKDIEDFAKKSEGKDFVLQPWDYAYFSQKLKLSLFNINSEMLRPYFELSRVKDGIFSLANKLYGIHFSINPDTSVYSQDVIAYDVNDKDGSYLGLLFLDFHPRKGKQGGAWMTSYSPQFINDKKDYRPNVAIVMNLTPPTPQRPSLLTLGEVTTFLHEFGHALHGLLADTTYRSLSGTNVLWDFVELPSQIMENFAVEKKFLSTFAVHYKTGEPLPEELIDKIIESRNFDVAYNTIRQLSFGLLDMAYYTLDKPFEEDIETFEHEAMKPAQLLPIVDGACMTVQFGHIMCGGYAAGYYSYKWAELLEADAFSEFKSHGSISSEVAERFRDCILSKGNTVHPMELYKKFRGKIPTIDAMLERDGIKEPATQEQ